MMLEFPADRECYTKPAENQVHLLAQPAMSGQRCLASDDARHGADSLPCCAQFMLGPDWLIAPVTAENATSWPAYLPKIPPEPSATPGEKTHEWVSAAAAGSLRAPRQKSKRRGLQVYWWNQSVVAEGQWVTVDTTALKDFPLFYRRPV